MKEEESNIIFGIRPLEEALTKKTTFLKVYVQKGEGDGLKFIKQMLNKSKVNYTEVPIEKLNTLSRFGNHQGVVAKISPIGYFNAETLCKEIFEKDQLPCFIALDRITDVRNFGAISRTAMANTTPPRLTCTTQMKWPHSTPPSTHSVRKPLQRTTP